MELEELKNISHVPRIVLNQLHTLEPGEERFVKYIDSYKEELVVRVFAMWQSKKRKDALWTEVERSIVGSEYSLQKNIYLTAMSGYRVVYKPEDKKSSNWYGYKYYYFTKEDFNQWTTNKEIPEYKGEFLNLEKLFEFDKYKYCGYSGQQPLKEYLRFYEKDPSVEFFGKLGLVYAPKLGKLAKKEKAFRSFIAKNVKDVNKNGPEAILFAYKNNIDIPTARKMMIEKHDASIKFRGHEKVPYKIDKTKIIKWWNSREDTYGDFNRTYKAGCYKNGYARTWGFNSYLDYWDACVRLDLDMRDTKNSMPHDFGRMHDLRINQYASVKKKIAKEKLEEFNSKIKKVAEKFSLTIPDGDYLVILPKTKADFVAEGTALCHCVGSMGYDVKVADGKVLIAFIRLKSEPEKPLYTVEFSRSEKRILQMHGFRNCTPDDKAKAFINKWAEAIKKVS